MTEVEKYLIKKAIPEEYASFFLRYNIAPKDISPIMLTKIKFKEDLQQNNNTEKQIQKAKEQIQNELAEALKELDIK